jgi:hypothetical protein
MYEPRLLGSWRSDAKRTARELAARRDIPAKSKKVLRKLFGRLELRYTRTKCYATLDGNTEALTYTVVARDSDSVAIVTNDPLTGQVVSHIHFTGSHLWVPVGSGMFREFFKRVRPSNTRLHPTAAVRDLR